MIVVGAVAGDAIGDQPAGKAELPVDAVLHRLEARVAAIGILHRSHLDRLLAREIARGVEAVDADVHHRSAAGQRPVEPPLVGRGVEAVLGEDQRRLAEHAGLHRLDGFQIVRLEMAAIADHQLLARLLGGGDHRLAFGDRDRHRLLAHHMFAGLVRADRVFGVHRVGQHDIDDVDVRIVADPVIGLVAVPVRLGDAVLGAVFLQLGGGAAHQRLEFGELAVLEIGEDLLGGVIAEADHRIAELALGGCLHRSAERTGHYPGADPAEHVASRSHDPPPHPPRPVGAAWPTAVSTMAEANQ